MNLKLLKNENFLTFIFMILFFLIGLYLLNLYVGWYGYEKWKYRRDTRGDINESIKRKVFIKKLNFEITPSYFMKYFDTKDTHFYIEKGYTCSIFSLEQTRLLNFKTTKYPYQLIINGISVIYLKEDNLLIKDSITDFPIYLENKTNDTFYFRLLKHEASNLIDPTSIKTIGIVKVF